MSCKVKPDGTMFAQERLNSSRFSSNHGTVCLAAMDAVEESVSEITWHFKSLDNSFIFFKDPLIVLHHLLPSQRYI